MKLLKEGFLKKNLGLGREYLVKRFCEDFKLPESCIDNDLNINTSYLTLTINSNNIDSFPKGDGIINIKSSKFCVEFHKIDFKKYPIQIFNKSDIEILELHDCENIDSFFEKNTFKKLEYLELDAISDINLDKLPKCYTLSIRESSLAQPVFKYKKLNVEKEIGLPLEFFPQMRFKRISQYTATLSIHNKSFYEKFKKWLDMINVDVKIRWNGWKWNADGIKYDK